MGEGVQGLSFWAGYLCNNGDWVQKRCRDKTSVTSKRVCHYSCALAVLSEQQGSVASCPRRTSSLVSCTASQSRLARNFRFEWATETRHTRMPNGIAQLQLPAYVTTRWFRNARHVWRRIISQVGIQLKVFGVRSRINSLQVSNGIVKYLIISSFELPFFIAEVSLPLSLWVLWTTYIHPWHRHQRCQRFYIGFRWVVKDCCIDWATLRRGSLHCPFLQRFRHSKCCYRNKCFKCLGSFSLHATVKVFSTVSCFHQSIHSTCSQICAQRFASQDSVPVIVFHSSLLVSRLLPPAAA